MIESTFHFEEIMTGFKDYNGEILIIRLAISLTEKQLQVTPNNVTMA